MASQGKTGLQDAGETRTKTEIVKEQKRSRAEQERLNTLRDHLTKTEQAVTHLEDELQMLEDSLTTPDVYNDHVAAQNAIREINAMKMRINKAYLAWEKAEQALESAQEDQVEEDQ